MGGGSSEEEVVAATAQQPVAQDLQMAQYPAFMPGQQNALASQMGHFYNTSPGDYMTMLGGNTQSVERPTLRNPTDIETYLNNLARAPQAAAAPVNVAQSEQTQADPLANMNRNSNR